MAERKQPIKIYGNDSLSDRMNQFKKKAEEHHHKQKINPFSERGKMGRTSAGNVLPCQVIDKNDPRYGRPVEGSKTEKRGIQAGNHISNEVRLLCEMIAEYGEFDDEDGTTSISFGELFEIYTRISNKVVGILIRARKHGLLHFVGEILFQRRDDDVVITMLKPIKELRKDFGLPEEPQWAKEKGIEKKEVS